MVSGSDHRCRNRKPVDKHFVLGQDRYGDSVLIDRFEKKAIRVLDPAKEPIEESETKKLREGKPLITLDAAKKAIGPASAVKQFANDWFGWAVKGQISPITEEAKNSVRIFNQTIKRQLLVNTRGAKFDVTNIDKILLNANKITKDPDSAATTLRNLHDYIADTIFEKERILRDEVTTKKQRQEFTSDINKLKIGLSYLPDEQVLFPERYLTEENINNMTVEEIRDVYSLKLTNEQKEMLDRRVTQLLEEQGTILPKQRGVTKGF